MQVKVAGNRLECKSKKVENTLVTLTIATWNADATHMGLEPMKLRMRERGADAM